MTEAIEIRIVNEGAKAYRDGKHYDVCPYERGEFRSLWLQGYRGALRAPGRQRWSYVNDYE